MAPRLPAAKHSAGLLVYRRTIVGAFEFLLVHPGGPYWSRRDDGAWSIPKGEIGPHEEPLAAAQREFTEETGLAVGGPFVALRPIRQRSGKVVDCWLVEADLDLSAFHSNTFDIEWPPRSGRTLSAPECDRAAYFEADAAMVKILPGQSPIIAQALGILAQADR